MNRGWEEREKLVERGLKGLAIAKERIEPANVTVYRFLPPGSSTDHAIDLSLVPTLADNLPDFTINSLFVDLGSGEIIDEYDGLLDLQDRILRTVKNPDEQFAAEPYLMFRAIKCVCQFNVSMDEETYAAMIKHADQVSRTFEFIEREKDGILVELFLANIFRGLNYNPRRYFETMRDSGILTEIIKYFVQKIPAGSKPIKNNPPNNFDVNGTDSFEKKISIFLSYLAREVTPNDAKKTFTALKRTLSLDRLMKYKDFEVDTAKILYNDDLVTT